MKNMIFILYPLFCILLPCLIYILLQILFAHKKTNMVHIVWVGIFLVYVYLVLETTGIGTIWEAGQYAGMEFQKEINLVPFHNGIEGFGRKEPWVYLVLSLSGQFFLFNWRWMV